MFKRSSILQRIRSVIAEHGRNFDYNLEMVVSHSRRNNIPIHVRYPASSTRGSTSSSSEAVANADARRSGGVTSGGAGGPVSSNPLQMLVIEPLQGKHVGLFPDGSAVCFDCNPEEVAKVRSEFKSCELPAEEALVAPRQVVKHQQYTLMSELGSLGYEAPAGHSYIDEGPLNAIVLENNDPKTKLPYMTCFGEMIQIEALDETLQPVVSKVSRWQNSTKKNGLLSCSLREVRMCRAQLSRIQERQNSLENRQKIFWQEGYNQLRQNFNDAVETWEIESRSAALKTKVDSVANSVAYFSEETHALTNHRLEWVIIVIIFLCLMNAVVVGH